MSAFSPNRDLKVCSIYALYVAGLRFVGDYDELDAVEQYLGLHPDADREAVEAELKAEISKRA